MFDLEGLQIAGAKFQAARLESDIEVLKYLTDDLFTFISPELGTDMKEGYLNSHRTRDIVFERMDEMIGSVRALGDELMLVSQRVKAEWTVAGKTFAGVADYTRFWRARNGQWTLLAEQCSIPASRN